jgi:hypothetical protein
MIEDIEDRFKKCQQIYTKMNYSERDNMLIYRISQEIIKVAGPPVIYCYQNYLYKRNFICNEQVKVKKLYQYELSQFKDNKKYYEDGDIPGSYKLFLENVLFNDSKRL